ncbi:MAG: TolC family protein [Myxococcales bacterium]|nr:TolC family protein [Myxococcales bacterium]
MFRPRLVALALPALCLSLASPSFAQPTGQQPPEKKDEGKEKIGDEPPPAPKPDPGVPSPEPEGKQPRPKPAPGKGLPGFDPRDPQIDEAMLQAIIDAEGDDLTRDVLTEVLAPVPEGLQPEQVANRAIDTSPSVAVSQAQIREASARLDQAFAAYFPRATLSASYTRVSNVNNVISIPGSPGPGITVPVQLNWWALSAGLEVPISDYLLRLTQAYAAASADVESRELERDAKKIQARAEAKAAYYNWVRTQGRAVVTGMAVALSKRHLGDAQASFAAGVISGADVARLESQVAQSRHLLATAMAMERVLAMQLRQVMHVELDTPLTIGSDVMAAPPERQKRTLPQLIDLARQHRLDLKALKQSKKTLENLESTTRAGYYPRLAGFADALYANPNQRFFTQDNTFHLTWDVGLRLTWTVNDTFQTLGAVAEAEAKTAQVGEQLKALEDGVVVAVTKSYYDIETARSAIAAADMREKAAKKSLDARRKLFRGGQATATEIIDAEAELIEARLQRVDAHVDVLISQAALEQAVGTRLD